MNLGPGRLPDPLELSAAVFDRCVSAAEGNEFTTYLVGVRGRKAFAELAPDEIKAYKSTVKLTVGNEIGELWEPLGRYPAFVRPEFLMIYDLDKRKVEIAIRSIYVYGRYRKLGQPLPQTRARWPCPECSRRGCETCEQTGRLYPTALEDLIGRPLSKGFGVTKDYQYALHGMGREDVNVRCLGQGRPFVLEIKSPPRRDADLVALAKRVEDESNGRVELPAPLRQVDAGVVARIKSWEADKLYLAVCEADADGRFDLAQVTALEARLTGAELEQRTPERVSRRRADKVRRRRVNRFVPRILSPGRFEAEIDAQSGTYIKELISGDAGRTTPSVAGLLGVPCTCVRLDVLEIHADDTEILGL